MVGELELPLVIGLTLVVALGPPFCWQVLTRRFSALPNGGPAYSLGLFSLLLFATVSGMVIVPNLPPIQWGRPTLVDVGIMIGTPPLLWMSGIGVGLVAQLLGINLSSSSAGASDSLGGAVAMVLAVGPVEEGAFRGFIQAVLIQAVGTEPGLLGMGVLFGLYHYPNSAERLRAINASVLGEMAVSGLGGVVLGCLYLLTGNLLVPIVGHSLHVATLLVYEHMTN